MSKTVTDFSGLLLEWFDQFGRHDLPWQKNISPYRVWLSEIMLQQTRVSTVIPYFNQFIEHFPDIKSLASASLDEVLHLWTGLGYYTRARNLHRTAILIDEQYSGRFPEDINTLMSLPGIGRSTAGAILSLAFHQRHPIMDGNVKRVLCRYYKIEGWPGMSGVESELWKIAERHTPNKRIADYTQAIMDLGATVCLRRNPVCEHCPLQQGCQAKRYCCQNSYPQKKPARKLPVRKTVFAILENHYGEILLEHRPPTGIWGGLWSFPECAPENDIEQWIENELGYVINSLEYRSGIRHTFSHFHLDIMPVHVKIVLNDGGSVCDSSRFCWYKPSNKQTLGMATPVKKILNTVTQE